MGSSVSQDDCSFLFFKLNIEKRQEEEIFYFLRYVMYKGRLNWKKQLYIFFFSHSTFNQVARELHSKSGSRKIEFLFMYSIRRNFVFSKRKTFHTVTASCFPFSLFFSLPKDPTVGDSSLWCDVDGNFFYTYLWSDINNHQLPNARITNQTTTIDGAFCCADMTFWKFMSKKLLQREENTKIFVFVKSWTAVLVRQSWRIVLYSKF